MRIKNRLLAAAALVPLSFAHANTFNWNSPGGGPFELSGNWAPPTPGAGPGAADTARFDLASTYDVKFSTDPTNTELQLSSGTVGFFSTSGSTYTLSGAANIDTNFSLSAMTLSAESINLNRTANLNAGSTLRIPGTSIGEMTMGPNGVLNLASGARLSVGVASPTAAIHLGYSHLFHLAGEISGRFSDALIEGEFYIESPALDTASLQVQNLTIAHPEGPRPGMLFINSSAFIRTGTLDNSSILELARANLTLSANTLLNSGTAYIHSGTNATFGGIVRNRNWFGTLNNPGEREVVHFIDGFINEAAGTFGVQSGVADLYGVSGATNGGAPFQNDGLVLVEMPSVPIYTPGELHFHQPFINNTSVQVQPGASVHFDGGLSGSGRLTGGGTFFVEGIMVPGDSPGLVSVTGTLDFESTAELQMELAGRVRGTKYDAIDVSGALDVDGTLRVLLISGFEPVPGDSFDLLNFTLLSGTFDQVILPPLTGGAWDTSNLYTSGVISVNAVPEPAALLLCLVPAYFSCARRIRRGVGVQEAGGDRPGAGKH